MELLNLGNLVTTNSALKWRTWKWSVSLVSPPACPPLQETQLKCTPRTAPLAGMCGPSACVAAWGSVHFVRLSHRFYGNER